MRGFGRSAKKANLKWDGHAGIQSWNRSHSQTLAEMKYCIARVKANHQTFVWIILDYAPRIEGERPPRKRVRNGAGVVT